jgi:hypothetical protein
VPEATGARQEFTGQAQGTWHVPEASETPPEPTEPEEEPQAEPEPTEPETAS